MSLSPQTKTYILLTILLFFLSLGGVYLYIQTLKATRVVLIDPPLPTVTISPGPTNAATASVTPSPMLNPSSSASPSAIPTPSPAPSPTTETSSVSPETEKEFTSQEDNFSVLYSSDRKVYQDTQSYGRRYTFFRPDANFAIHVGTDWSWIYPNRQFSNSFPVSGQSSFRYDIEAQTIVDVKYGDTLYTIQCVHSGSTATKSECEKFLESFKFL